MRKTSKTLLATVFIIISLIGFLTGIKMLGEKEEGTVTVPPPSRLPEPTLTPTVTPTPKPPEPVLEVNPYDSMISEANTSFPDLLEDNPDLVEEIAREMSSQPYRSTYVPCRIVEWLHPEVHGVAVVDNEVPRNISEVIDGFISLLDVLRRVDPELNKGLEYNERIERIKVLCMAFLYRNFSASWIEENYKFVKKAMNLAGNYTGLVEWNPQKADVLIALCEDIPESLMKGKEVFILAAADSLPSFFYYFHLGPNGEKGYNEYVPRDLEFIEGLGSNNKFDERNWTVLHIVNILSDMEKGMYINPSFWSKNETEQFQIARILIANGYLLSFRYENGVLTSKDLPLTWLWNYTTEHILLLKENWELQDYWRKNLLKDLPNEDRWRDKIYRRNMEGSDLLPWIPEILMDLHRKLVKVLWDKGSHVDRAYFYAAAIFHDKLLPNLSLCRASEDFTYYRDLDLGSLESAFMQSVGLPAFKCVGPLAGEFSHGIALRFTSIAKNALVEELRADNITNILIFEDRYFPYPWLFEEVALSMGDEYVEIEFPIYGYFVAAYLLFDPKEVYLSDVHILGDVNGDEISELILERGEKEVLVKEEGGEEVWKTNGSAFLVVGDVDRDSINDVIVFTIYREGAYLLSGKNGRIMRKIDISRRASGEYSPLCSKRVKDINRDGIDEISLTVKGQSVLLSGSEVMPLEKAKIWVSLSKDLKPTFYLSFQWSGGEWEIIIPELLEYPKLVDLVGDLNGDGVGEVLLANFSPKDHALYLTCFSGKNGRELWNTSLTLPKEALDMEMAVLSVIDLDKDGNEDILLAYKPTLGDVERPEDCLYVISANGSQMWALSLPEITSLIYVKDLGLLIGKVGSIELVSFEGEVLWETNVGLQRIVSLDCIEGLVLAFSSSGRIITLDPQSGTILEERGGV